MTTTIPAFTNTGHLPEGIHVCSGDAFIERFCRQSHSRQGFEKAVIDVLDFAAARNASYVFVGGSFVTRADEPRDLDVVIVLKRKEHIPSKNERLVLNGKRTDIMFCSEDEPKILDAFVRPVGQMDAGEAKELART